MIVVTIILFFFLGVIFGKLFNNKETNEINETKRNQLLEQEKELQNSIEQKEYQLKILKEESERRGSEYLEKEMKIADCQKQIFINGLEQEKEEARLELDYQKRLAELDYKEQVARLNKDIDSIKKDIEDLTSKRESLIEANKREEELKNKIKFYQVQLSEDDISDIELILSIGKKLNKQCFNKLIWSEFYSKPFKEMCGRVIGGSKTSGIYKITEIESGKVYVGQSVDIATRWSNHLKASLGIDGIAHNKIHDAINEIGLQNFTFEILEKCEKEKLNEREKFYIEVYKSYEYGYNSTKGGS